jgi:hypothetical protein
MKRKITQWTLIMALAISLVACATTGRYASTNDDIYYSPTKISQASIATTTETTNKDAEIQQLKRETQAAIKANAKRLATDSTIVVVENDNSYRSIVSDSYEDSYERRLRGYNSPSYGTESVIRITTSSDWLLVSSFDPAFYNIIIMGDEIWVEPKYITSMFSPVRTTINLGLGYGNYWNSWYYPRYGFGWGLYNSWYSWYSPWYYSSWYYPYYGSYWGWGSGYYGCGWNYGYNGYWGHRHNNYNPHWGLGRPSISQNTYNRRTNGTMAQNRVPSANNGNNRMQDVTGSTRRTTRNMEMVSNRMSQGAGNSTNVSAGNRRGDAVENTTGSNRTQQGTVTRDVRNTVGTSRITQQSETSNAQTQEGRRNSQVYTRPATASRQSYNESTATSGTARRNVTGSNSGTARVIGSSPSSTGSSSARSVSTSRYTTGSSSSSNSGNNSSGSSSYNSRSGNSSSVSRSSSNSSSSSSSYSPSSSSSSRSSGSSSSSSGSSSSGGGGRRR